MKSPMTAFTPDYSPVVKMMAMQTRLAIETSQSMMKLAMLPWKGLPMMKTATAAAPKQDLAAKQAAPKAVETPKAAPKPAPAKAAEAKPEAAKPAAPKKAAPKAKAAKAEPPKTAAPKSEAPKPEAPKAEAKPAPVTEVAKSADKAAAPKAAAQPDSKPAPKMAPKAEAMKPAAKVQAEPAIQPDTKADAKPESTPAPAAKAAGPVAPVKLAAPEGTADDLTVLNGVGPKLAEALNSIGIYHYKQIAAWTGDNVSWVDDNVAGVRGRASKNGWVAQAADLAK